MRLVPGNIKGIRQARMDHCRKECGVRSRGRESTVAAAAAPGEWPGPGPVGHGALTSGHTHTHTHKQSATKFTIYARDRSDSLEPNVPNL
jgi:hypothetical protein